MKQFAVAMELRKHVFTLLLCALLVPLAPTTVAQALPDQGVSQGRAAVILATALGLNPGSDTSITEDRAIALLSAEGIAPTGGWNSDAELNAAELARFMGQALGLDEEFTQEQLSDSTAQAYKDALVSDFDIDVDNLGDLVARDGQNVTLLRESDVIDAIAAVIPTFNQTIINSDRCVTDC